jgi:pilus assembly protein CpaE
MTGGSAEERSLRALLICPDSVLAAQFTRSTSTVAELDVQSHLDQYPPGPQLKESLRQIAPEVVMVDVATDLGTALQLTAVLLESAPEAAVVALHTRNDPDAILQSLRAGCSEFLSSPFPTGDVTQAMQRVLRRRPTETPVEPARRGRLIVFAPVKGGSGASTLAANVAYQVNQQIDGKVLLADFDVTQGVLSFTLRVNHQYAVTDALRHAGEMDRKLWGSLVVEKKGVDLLLAPERPEPALIEPYPVQAVLEHARNIYDVVVVDLGGVCESMSMATLSAAQDIYLVCSAGLASLYMMRRTIPLVEELGYSRDHIHVVVNQLPRRAELSLGDMEKIFRASVHATFPEDRAAVSIALREGNTLPDSSDLSRAVGKFVRDFVGNAPPQERVGFGVRALKELLSGT